MKSLTAPAFIAARPPESQETQLKRKDTGGVALFMQISYISCMEVLP
jgi:hypothetical protein